MDASRTVDSASDEASESAAQAGQWAIAYRLREVLQRRDVGSAAALFELVSATALPSWARAPQRRTLERHYSGQVRMTPQDLALYLAVIGESPTTLNHVITGEAELFIERDPLQNSRQVSEIVRIITSFIPSAVVQVEPQYLSPRYGVERGRFVIAYEDTLRPLRDPVRDVEWLRLHNELVGAGAELQHQLLRRGPHTQRLRAILGLEPIEVLRDTEDAEQIAAAVRPPLLAAWVPGLTRLREAQVSPHAVREQARVIVVCGYAGLFGPSLGPLIADGLGWGFIDLDRVTARRNSPIGESVERILSNGKIEEHTIVGTRFAKSTKAVLAAVASDPERAAAAGIRLLLPRMLERNLRRNIERDFELVTRRKTSAISTPLPVRGPVLSEVREPWDEAAALANDLLWDAIRERGLLWEIENLPWLHYGTTQERSEAGVATAAMCLGWISGEPSLHPASRRWTQLVHEGGTGAQHQVPRQLWAEVDAARAVGVLHRRDDAIRLPQPADGERTYASGDLARLPYEPMQEHTIRRTQGGPRPLAEAGSKILMIGGDSGETGIVAQI